MDAHQSFNRSPLSVTATVIAIFLLIGCEPPATPQGPGAPGVEAPALPTAANLLGVWNDTATYREGPSDIVTTKRKITFSEDNGWSMSNETETKPAAGDSSFSYAESRGTFSVSGDALTTTTTGHRNSSTPFVNEDGWLDDTGNPIETQLTAFLYGGKLYANPKYPVYKVSGVHTTLVGTWIAIFSSTQDSWRKYVWEFQDASHAVHSRYSSTTTTDFGSPITIPMDYELISETEIELGGGIQHYLKVGGYFVIGDETALGAATKE